MSQAAPIIFAPHQHTPVVRAAGEASSVCRPSEALPKQHLRSGGLQMLIYRVRA